MVFRQVCDLQGPKKQFLEELLGQPLAKDEQVYIMVYPGREMDARLRPLRQSPENSGWTTAKNAQRVELIDRQIEGSLSPEERVELDFLQQQFRAFRQQDAPLPIEKARQLHRELLDKKRRQEQATR
jgi:hypothetical protein